MTKYDLPQRVYHEKACRDRGLGVQNHIPGTARRRGIGAAVQCGSQQCGPHIGVEIVQPTAKHPHQTLGQRERPDGVVDLTDATRKFGQRQRVAGRRRQNRRRRRRRQRHPGLVEQFL